ncbi:epidermal retinal dehydrogenase [Pseudozyma hubeiensis SY62]|uniref:Epidermal retinal dehydrogenase n=1 Tax=Pseudozyma hubeiensis (strain SY62) TaxID=1305764 RepID=R9NYR1_PSEHS|nr:epidermal retinal dehydrogenase [Pseudozyma hubeiensis SY62]GAC93958.1 epidermal retinal dehydrogenase [Pseudozyma hubeiensis SY62]
MIPGRVSRRASVASQIGKCADAVLRCFNDTASSDRFAPPYCNRCLTKRTRRSVAALRCCCLALPSSSRIALSSPPAHRIALVSLGSGSRSFRSTRQPQRAKTPQSGTEPFQHLAYLAPLCHEAYSRSKRMGRTRREAQPTSASGGENMSVLSIDTVVVLFKWTLLNPLLSIAYLAALGCDRYTCKSSNEWVQHGLRAAKHLLVADASQRTSIGVAAIVVLLGWSLVLSSHLWYNRVYLRPIRRNQWKDQLVLITGGASGIGYRTAMRFASKGARVVVIDIRKLPDPQASSLSSRGPNEAAARQNISAYICDLASEDALTKVLKSILAIHGTPTVVINNAGFTHSQPITRLSASQISRLIHVNLTSHLWILQHLLPHMIQSARADGRSSHIVSTASVMGHTGVSQMIDYCASKHGVVGLHKALRYELDYCHRCPQIRTTLLVLGHVKTQLFDGLPTNILARFLGPVVHPDAVAKRIVTAVEKRRGGTIAMPWYANWSEVFALLPSWATDLAHWLLASNSSMDGMNRARQKQS